MSTLQDRQSRPSQQDALLPAACSVALITLLPVALRQLQLVKHLPDPASKLFDSDGITGSKQAYPLGMPDGLLGLGSYTATLVLVLLVRRSSRETHGGRLLIPRVLGAKLFADGSAAAFNTVRQVFAFRKLCSWCMGTVLATAVMVYAGRRFIVQVLPR